MRGGKRAFRRLLPLVLPVLLVVAGCARERKEEIAYSELKQRIAAGEVARVRVAPHTVEAVPTEGARRLGAPDLWVAVPIPNDDQLALLLDRHGVAYEGLRTGQPNPMLLAVVTLFALGLLFLAFHLQRRAARNASGVAQIRLRDARSAELEVDFSDVAGADEAKEELEEVVAFLKNPEKFVRLGARIPKGVLLVGPPGTGKTLLARAVAGEAGVPFFSISGSEFVEVFVGVGAARVRRLFERAKAKAPCIVFIDELDAIGRSRSAGHVMAGNEEREQTLNQLLVELDGFEPRAGIVVMGATNRPEVLDAALLRPGRFDRQVVVDRPDRAGREAILRVHARKIKLAPEVDLAVVARRTPGFVGADLANVLNEAALLAARKDKLAVGMEEIDAAIDRVVAGLEKKSRLIDEKERRIVAYHEAGHAIVAELLPTTEPVKKISIIPRGIGALGYMQQVPDERNLMQQDELLDRLCVLLGGRAAEQLVFGQVSTGAANDLERATALARRMVCEFGMSEALGPVAYVRREGRFLGGAGGEVPGSYSETTAWAIDREVQALVTGALERSLELLARNRESLEAVAERLLAQEVMERAELLSILGTPSPA